MYFLLSNWVCHDFTSIWNLFAKILKLRAFWSKYSDSNWWKYSEQFYANTLKAIGGSLLFCRKIHGKYKHSADLTKIGRSFFSSCGLHQRVCKDEARSQKPIQSTSPNAQLRPKTNLERGYLANGCIWKDPINSVIKCRVASSFLIKVDFVEN